MDYFAGLDISMDETLVCVLDREGVVVRESKTESTAQAIAGELSKAPSCRRIVFETGRMAPILFHELSLQLKFTLFRIILPLNRFLQKYFTARLFSAEIFYRWTVFCRNILPLGYFLHKYFTARLFLTVCYLIMLTCLL